MFKHKIGNRSWRFNSRLYELLKEELSSPLGWDITDSYTNKAREIA